jgi:hypothetical protein
MYGNRASERFVWPPAVVLSWSSINSDLKLRVVVSQSLPSSESRACAKWPIGAGGRARSRPWLLATEAQADPNPTRLNRAVVPCSNLRVESMLTQPPAPLSRASHPPQVAEGGNSLVGQKRSRLRMHNRLSLPGGASRGASHERHADITIRVPGHLTWLDVVEGPGFSARPRACINPGRAERSHAFRPGPRPGSTGAFKRTHPSMPGVAPPGGERSRYMPTVFSPTSSASR